MRRRLLASTLLVAVIGVLLLGIPLAWRVNRLIEEEATQELSSQAKSLLGEVEYAAYRTSPSIPNS